MKNVLVLFFALCAFATATTVNAQVTIGPRVGIILSDQVSDVDEFDPDSRTGVQFGGFLNLPIGDADDGGFAIQPEIMYSQRGIKTEQTEIIIDFSTTPPTQTTITTDVDQILNYLEIPIMLQYNFKGDGIGFFLQGGPYVAIAMSGKIKAGDAEEDIDFDEAGISETDFGFQAGAGAGIYVGSAMIFLDARYIFAVTNLIADDDVDATINNTGIGVSAGVRIPISN